MKTGLEHRSVAEEELRWVGRVGQSCAEAWMQRHETDALGAATEGGIQCE